MDRLTSTIYSATSKPQVESIAGKQYNNEQSPQLIVLKNRSRGFYENYLADLTTISEQHAAYWRIQSIGTRIPCLNEKWHVLENRH